MARVCFEATVRLGFKFTEEAELYNGGMKFRKGGGLGTACLCFQALFTCMSVSRVRSWTPSRSRDNKRCKEALGLQWMLLESAAAIQELSGANLEHMQ